MLALGSFFHYAEGFSKPQSYDLTLPETNPVGKFKDIFFPSPRMDFYACVEARKLKDSPHGKMGEMRPPVAEQEVEGLEFKPKLEQVEGDSEKRMGLYY